MAISLVAVIVRHERRLRLLFGGDLAAGAYAPGPYAIACTNARGPSPTVLAAMQVAGQTNLVELAFDSDLASGGIYTLTCTAVPAADASTFTGTEAFHFGIAGAPPENIEPAARDAEELLYGIDLVWTGADFLETVDGDLAVVGGMPNVQAALHRRIEASGLPWAPGYGPSLEDYVNGPSPIAGTARGGIVRDLRKDDRVASVDATLIARDDLPDEVTFNIAVTLVGDRQPGAFTHTVKS